MYSKQPKEIELTDVILRNTEVIRPNIETTVKQQLRFGDQRLENLFYHLAARYLDSKFFYDEQGNELSEAVRTTILFTCYKKTMEELNLVPQDKLFNTALNLTYSTIDSICFNELANYSAIPKKPEQVQQPKPQKKGILGFFKRG